MLGAIDIFREEFADLHTSAFWHNGGGAPAGRSHRGMITGSGLGGVIILGDSAVETGYSR